MKQLEPLFINADHSGAVFCADNIEFIKQMADNSVSAVVTDPPFGWLFQGNIWDQSVPVCSFWKEVCRVLKPGGFVLSLCGTRTYHRMAVNIEDAGFVCRDVITYVHAQGFPKSMNVSKQLDRIAGKERKVVGRGKHPTLKDTGKLEEQENAAHGGNKWMREWDLTTPASDLAKKYDGFGTALKPACEFIGIFQKPISEKNIALNVMKWGCGAFNIDACRIPFPAGDAGLENGIKRAQTGRADFRGGAYVSGAAKKTDVFECSMSEKGRWPTNFIHDGSADVMAIFDKAGVRSSGDGCVRRKEGKFGKNAGLGHAGDVQTTYGDSGSVARFFFCAKAGRSERVGVDGEKHPTQKSLELMEYLIKLVACGGPVLDPFCGSGTTLVACEKQGVGYVGIDQEEKYCKIAVKRLKDIVRQSKLF